MSGVSQVALANELNQLSSSRIIADSTFRLLFANTHAQVLLKSGNIFSVTPDHQLVFQHPDHKRQLNRAFSQRMNGGDTPLVILTSEFTQVVIRKIETDRNSHYYSISVFDERTLKQPDEHILKASFGLTNAETRLALLLVNGFTIADATEKLCVSRHTVRAHLRALFDKFDVSRQTDLVRKIISGPAMS